MLRNLTDEPHIVYRAYSKTGRLLYVGVTVDPDIRLEVHERTAPWASECADITRTTYASKADAYAAETEAIRTENPVHNKKGYLPQELARVTLNLPPALMRDIERWALDAASALEVPRVSTQDALRAMIRACITDDQASSAALGQVREENSQ